MDIGNIVFVLGVILLSMTLHEAMHAFMSYWLGDDTAKHQGRLTLNPIKHIDPFLTIILPVFLAVAGGPIFGGAKPVPFRPDRVKYGEWGAALVAVAGPITNLLIAFVLYGALVLSGGTESAAYQPLTIAILVNLGFFVFNMLPIPPLDGSRVIYALAPDFIRRGMEVVEAYGIMLVFAFVLLAGPFLGQAIGAGVDGILNAFELLFRV